MSIQTLKKSLGDYAKDIKLNLSSVLAEEGAPGLSLSQIHGVALSCAYATRNTDVITAIEGEVALDTEVTLDPAAIEAAKAAATIMAMNNIYYRFCHMVGDQSFLQMPARLRMNVIGAPGIEKLDFELYSLAVSAINGCGMCIESHVKQAKGAGVSAEGIQSTVRIAAVINAAAQAAVIATNGKQDTHNKAA